MVDRLLLLARTARHLRPVQLLYAPLRRAQGILPVPRPTPRARWCDTLARRLEPEVRAWRPADMAECVASAHEVIEGRFRWLAREEHLPVVDWQAQYGSRLWTYHLHYFDYAIDLAWAHRVDGDPAPIRRLEELALAWIVQTRGGHGPGWEPYPLSKRIINWCYALLIAGDGVRPDVKGQMVASLARQLGALEARLELDLQANHLQKNLSALALGALLFDGASADHWRSRWLSALRDTFLDQVLPDGVHAERAPMYHAIALADLLEHIALSRAAGLFPPEPVVSRAVRMREAWQRLTRADGSLHLFNDSAEGVGPDSRWLSALGNRVLGTAAVPEGPFAMGDGGFYGLVDSATGTRLVIDAGAPAPAHQPAHAHCGILSYELDLGGERVVTDAGVAGYDGDPYRAYVRSTRAHNTVGIDGLEQSEIWGTFRVARRGAVVAAGADLTGGVYRFSGACRPYHSPQALHRRRIERVPGGWRIVDVVEGAPGRLLESFLHLAPGFQVRQAEAGYLARKAGLAIQIEPFGVDSIELAYGQREPMQGWHCPRFGVAQPAEVMTLRVERNAGQLFGYEIRVGA